MEKVILFVTSSFRNIPATAGAIIFAGTADSHMIVYTVYFATHNVAIKTEKNGIISFLDNPDLEALRNDADAEESWECPEVVGRNVKNAVEAEKLAAQSCQALLHQMQSRRDPATVLSALLPGAVISGKA